MWLRRIICCSAALRFDSWYKQALFKVVSANTIYKFNIVPIVDVVFSLE